jgi:hypothetical protein
MERSAAEFAVGNTMQADRFLHPNHVAYGLVLDSAKFVGV